MKTTANRPTEARARVSMKPTENSVLFAATCPKCRQQVLQHGYRPTAPRAMSSGRSALRSVVPLSVLFLPPATDAIPRPAERAISSVALKNATRFGKVQITYPRPL